MLFTPEAQTQAWTFIYTKSRLLFPYFRRARVYHSNSVVMTTADWFDSWYISSKTVVVQCLLQVLCQWFFIADQYKSIDNYYDNNRTWRETDVGAEDSIFVFERGSTYTRVCIYGLPLYFLQLLQKQLHYDAVISIGYNILHIPLGVYTLYRHLGDKLGVRPLGTELAKGHAEKIISRAQRFSSAWDKNWIKKLSHSHEIQTHMNKTV